MVSEALSKGWAALPRLGVKVTPREGPCVQAAVQKGHTSPLELPFPCAAEPGWRSHRHPGRTLEQGHFCTKQGLKAAQSGKRAQLKTELSAALD